MKLSHSLQGRHALVTGAARGIGAAIVRTLVEEGASVSMLGRNRQALDELAAELPTERVHIVTADVTDYSAVEAAFNQARARFGPVILLINNAGQAHSAPFQKTTLELWQRMLQVNLSGTFICSQMAVADMLAAGYGRIVNIASTAAQKGYAYVSAYVAAKHGVLGLTRALAIELATKNITVNAVCPGYTDTDLFREGVANAMAKTGRSAEEIIAQMISGNPQKRVIQPQEVADAVRWLCGESAASVTGQAISVSGGEVTA